MAMSFDKQKMIDFLEQNAQWFAVGAGGLFVLWMGYSFWASPPVKVQGKDGTDVTPGQVEESMAQQAQSLEDWAKATPTSYKDTLAAAAATRDRLKSATNSIDPAGLPTFSPLAVRTRSFDLTAPAAEIPDVARTDSGPVDFIVPTSFPAPTIEKVTSGRSYVSMVAGAGVAAAGFGGNNPAAGANPADSKDVFWVRVPYNIQVNDLVKALAASNLPSNLRQTEVVRVELIRQRQLSDGSFGEETVIPALSMQQALLRPFPPGNSPTEQGDYDKWAQQNQLLLVQPAFYPQIIAGDNPGLVSVDSDNSGFPNFDPATFNKDENLLSSEQLKQLREYRSQQQRQRDEQRHQSSPTPRSPGGMPGNPGGSRRGAPGAGVFLAPASDHPASTVNFDSRIRPAGQTTDFQGPPPMGGPPFGAPPFDPGMGAPVAGQAITVAPLPTAPIDLSAPSTATPPAIIQGWLFDETVKPTETYQYRVRYYLENPLMTRSRDANAVPKAVLPFAIVGENKTVWSSAVEVPAVSHFFVTAPVGGTSVKFSLYRWQAGKVHKTEKDIKLGDAVGSIDSKDNIDYRTNCTLVAIRSNGSENYALVMTPDGRIQAHSRTLDTSNEAWKRLERDLARDQPPTTGGPEGGAAGAGGPGGPSGMAPFRP